MRECRVTVVKLSLINDKKELFEYSLRLDFNLS